jgi:hypothetical protein
MMIRKSAELSPCGRYRWWLHRSGLGGHGVVCFLMLNPSTADAEQDDPTIRRCIGFARAWGYDVLSVRNLFPLRATEPRVLRTTEIDPTGGARGLVEALVGATAHRLVLAWGAHVPFGRDRLILSHLHGVPLWCLGITRRGNPRHPLYVARAQPCIPYSPQEV